MGAICFYDYKLTCESEADSLEVLENTQVYTNDIELVAQEYIDDLPNSDDMKNNKKLFTDMLKYINKRLFKTEYKQLYNRKSNVNTDDIDLLNDYWDAYTSLCYKHNKNPDLRGFSLMVGIDNTTFTSWNNGEVRGGPTSPHSLSVKKWLNECEYNLRDEAASGNPGPMFLLKCNYGYAEAARPAEVTTRSLPGMTVDEIAKERGVDLLPEPEKPDFDE